MRKEEKVRQGIYSHHEETGRQCEMRRRKRDAEHPRKTNDIGNLGHNKDLHSSLSKEDKAHDLSIKQKDKQVAC